MLRGFYPGYPVHPVLSYSRRSRGDPLSHSSSWGKASRIENRGSTIARSKTALDPRRLTFVGRSSPGPSPPLFLDRVGMPSPRLCYSRSCCFLDNISHKKSALVCLHLDSGKFSLCLLKLSHSFNSVAFVVASLGAPCLVLVFTRQVHKPLEGIRLEGLGKLPLLLRTSGGSVPR